MTKLLAVLKREYLQTVRKPSFIILTLLAPFLMGALLFLPALLAMKGMGEKRVAVVDGTGKLGPAIQALATDRAAPVANPLEEDDEARDKKAMPVGLVVPEYVDASGKDVKAAAAPYFERLTDDKVAKERRLDGVLLVPAGAFEDASLRLTYYSRSSTDLVAHERLGRVVNRALARQRLAARGLDAAEVDTLLQELKVDTVQLTKSGKEKRGGRDAFLVAMLFLMLLFLPALLHGQEVMRGVIAEKTDRIVEILISSMSSLELLSGKVLGIAAVGLTQVAVWIATAALMTVYILPAAAAAGVDPSAFFKPVIAAYFLLFFVLGYLIYVCVYAIGGAIVNSEKEAQQVLMPVMFILMVPWFLVTPVLMSPDSTLAVALSLIPVYTPTTMFIRILVSEPPVWQILLSIALSVATVWAMLWATAKIFRVALLAYGKRPTIPELWEVAAGLVRPRA